MERRTKKVFLAEIVSIVLTAVILGLFTYFVIYIRLAGGHRLIAYAYNIVLIAVILVFDKVADYYMSQEDFLTKDSGKIKNLFAKLLFATHLVSFKTALYLFYIVMIVLSRISILEPDLINRYQISFIYSVEYGIVLLIPLDKFLELLTKDDKRIMKILSRLGRK